MDMTYALVIHNGSSFALMMAPDVVFRRGILGPMVMQFRNLRGVRLLGFIVGKNGSVWWVSNGQFWTKDRQFVLYAGNLDAI